MPARKTMVTQVTTQQLEEEWSTKDIRIISADQQVKGIATIPRLRRFKTNNFIQNGLNRLLGYIEAEKVWTPIKVNADGELIVGQSVLSKDTILVQVATSLLIPSGGTAVLAGVDTAGMDKLMLMVQSTGALTVFPQFSPDDSTYFTAFTKANAALTFSSTTENRAFPIEDVGPYTRFLFNNTQGADITVNAWLSVVN